MKSTGSGQTSPKPLLKGFHHAAIVCRDYKEAVDFYVNKLGLRLYRETYDAEKNRLKLELWLEERYLLEIFIMPDAPEGENNRITRAGHDHLSFLAEDVVAAAARLREMGVQTTEVLKDKSTGKNYAFFFGPHGQKLELYQE